MRLTKISISFKKVEVFSAASLSLTHLLSDLFYLFSFGQEAFLKCHRLPGHLVLQALLFTPEVFDFILCLDIRLLQPGKNKSEAQALRESCEYVPDLQHFHKSRMTKVACVCFLPKYKCQTIKLFRNKQCRTDKGKKLFDRPSFNTCIEEQNWISKYYFAMYFIFHFWNWNCSEVMFALPVR